MRTTLRAAFFAVVVAIAAGGCTGNPTLPSTMVSTLSISGAPPGVGTSAQYIASAIASNSSSAQDVTAVATWTVSDSSVATVSKTGLVTGVKAGTMTLTATYGGSSVSQQVTVHS